MVREGHELVHPLADALLRPEVVEKRHDLRHHQKGIAVGGIVTVPLQRCTDHGKHGLGGVGEDQVERGGSGHPGR